MDALSAAVALIAENGNVDKLLKAYQYTNRLAELSVLGEVTTRWEGLYLSLERCLELQESLPSLLKVPSLDEPRRLVSDLFQPSFFERCEKYAAYLKQMKLASELYQTHGALGAACDAGIDGGFCTKRSWAGCTIPRCVQGGTHGSA
jgi:hypothetical protein